MVAAGIESGSRRAVPKVFGIGFPRTGTTSLVRALNILGVKSIHNPAPLLTTVEHPLLDEYQGFADAPVPLIYRRLDALFPGSKFVFTVRDVDDWLTSARWMLEVGRRHGRWDENPEIVAMHRALYGAIDFSEELFRERFLRHRTEVLEYFSERSEDLLVMDLTVGDGWEMLCPFIGRPAPGGAFPHANPRGSYRWARATARVRRALLGILGRRSQAAR